MPFSDKQKEFDRQIDLMQIREFRKSGKNEILKDLYQKYMPLVYGVCLKYLKSRKSAKDATLKIYGNFEAEAKKNEIPNLRNWLYSSTVNYCNIEMQK
jgi:RNA polymerase sigma-70 factor (ECF subfamily)